MLAKTPSAEFAIHAPMRGLMQRLSLGPQGRSTRIIAFISARGREGTTSLSRSYAEALAQEGNQKVLLIDAGPKRLKRYQAHIDPGYGIVDTMIAGQLPGDAIVAEETIATGRWLALDENRAAAAKMMHSNDFWQSLLKSFDSIIIDAPSLQSSYDGIALAARADATVIVIEAEKTTQPVVQHLYETLVSAGAKVVGCVMNKRRFYIPSRVYRKKL